MRVHEMQKIRYWEYKINTDLNFSLKGFINILQDFYDRTEGSLEEGTEVGWNAKIKILDDVITLSGYREATEEDMEGLGDLFEEGEKNDIFCN